MQIGKWIVFFVWTKFFFVNSNWKLFFYYFQFLVLSKISGIQTHLKKVGVIYMFLYSCCVGNNSSRDLSDPISTLKYFSSLIRTIMNYKRVSLTQLHTHKNPAFPPFLQTQQLLLFLQKLETTTSTTTIKSQ